MAGLLDFDRPVAVLAVAVGHFVEGDLGAILTRYRELVAVLAGLEIVPPGMVDVTDWPTPQPDIAHIGVHAAVARVP